MRIVFDLDGTLIESSRRMYELFQRLVPESNLTKDEYWNLKRSGMNHKALLAKYVPGVDFDDFNACWLRLIEVDDYLDMDERYPDTLEVLGRLRERHEIVLLTARQLETGLTKELSRLGLTGYFSQVLTTANRCTKADLLDKLQRHDGDWFISDMGKDITLAKEHQYLTAAITHGFMDGGLLKKYQPDLLVGSLSEFASAMSELP